MNKFNENISAAVSAHVPCTTTGGRTKPWFDAKCYSAAKDTRIAFAKWKSSKTPSRYLAYKRCVSLGRSVISQAKANHLLIVSGKIASSSHDPKQWVAHC